MGEMKKTTIQIGQDTKEALSNMGRKGETYDQIIQKLIEAQRKPNK